MRAPLALLTLVLSATSARAGADVGVVVTGEATMQPQLAAQLEGWLRSHGHRLVASPLPPEAVNTLIDCFVIEDEGCARGLIEKRAKSEAVVFARVEVVDNAGSGMRDVTVTAYWFDKGHDPVAERRFCERCTEQSLRNTADDLMSALAGANRKDVGHLKLATSPAGAHVVIDGQSIGVTPIEYSLAPGEHKLAISHEGRRDDERSVTIRKGETTPVEVTLAIADGLRPSRVLPISLMAGGAAVLITGIYVYSLAEPDRGTTPEFHDSRNHALGVGISVVGLAAAGVGAYLFIKSGKPESVPAVALLPGGGYIGWARSF